jgi:hypothetical protein
MPNDPPLLFDLVALQTMTGAELGPLRTKIPAADALRVLQAEQAQAITGEHGVGVVVFLRPSGEPSPADVAADLEAALADATQLRRAVETVVHFWRNDPLAFGDDATPTTMAGRFADVAWLCESTLEATETGDGTAGQSLLAELDAARAVVATARQVEARELSRSALSAALAQYDATRVAKETPDHER